MIRLRRLDPGTDVNHPLDDLAGSLADAERMLAIVDGLSDIRIQRMRSDQKQTLGAALKVPSSERAQLERAEGREAWVIIKPGAGLRRDMFGADALAPLIRQSVVVIAAAVEVYVAASVNRALAAMLATSGLPTVARERLAKDVETRTSAAPRRIGEAVARIGIELDLATIRGEDGATAADVLGRLSAMRNRIAHGSVAESPAVPQVRMLLAQVRQVTDRLDSIIEQELRAQRSR